MISVALIEDNRLVREGISALLGGVKDLVVVAAGPRVVRSLLQRVQPQVVLLDLGLANGNSLQVAKRVMKEHPGSRVIVMDLLPVHEELVEFADAGVAGFIAKDATLDDLVATIRRVAKGSRVLPPSMSGTLLARIAGDAARRRRGVASATRMTPREREVIGLIAEGLSNKEIAGRMQVATYTVRSHVRNVMEKLALHTRLQIAAYAHRGRG